jgi:hypothetical protein
MDQDAVVQLVAGSGLPLQESTRQKQHNQVRFYGRSNRHSVNLGYSEPRGVFVVDFVFKTADRKRNVEFAEAFIKLYGGYCPDRSTVFVRLEPAISDEPTLVGLLSAYLAVVFQ